MRAKPPGLVAAQMDPSEVSASQRTLSPPSPSCLVQLLVTLEPSRRTNPRPVPTQRAPFLSRRMLQIKSDGRPWSIFQDSQSPRSSHRATPPPTSPIQTDPSRSSSTAAVTSLLKPRCRFTMLHPAAVRIARPLSVGTITEPSRPNVSAPQNPLDAMSGYSCENMVCPAARRYMLFGLCAHTDPSFES